MGIEIFKSSLKSSSFTFIVSLVGGYNFIARLINDLATFIIGGLNVTTFA